MRILCVGISHKSAQVAQREKLAMDAPGAAAALANLAQRWPQAEFVLLSTCNRTEVYAARALHDHPRDGEIRRWLCEWHGQRLAEFDPALYTLADAEAIRHLLAVTAGLESLVLGEAQIIAQAKDAYRRAQAAGTARGILGNLFQKALHTAKHVRSQTQLGHKGFSVASAAVECVRRQAGCLQGKTVLSIGAGKMNALMLRELRTSGVQDILVANRSPDKARELAAACGGRSVPLDRLPEAMEQADIVLSSTGAPTPIVTQALVEQVQARRRHRPLLLVDIAVPRDVEPSAGQIRGVTLENIDDLETIVQALRAEQAGQVAPAEAIIDDHTREILQDLDIRQVAPAIEALYRRMRQIADDELDLARRRLSTHDDAQADEKILRHVLHRVIRKIVHPAAESLRDAAGSDAARSQVAALRKLFQLDEQ